jgi:2-phosphoglycerate kinase
MVRVSGEGSSALVKVGGVSSDRGWDVLLVGGASGVGKTTLSVALSRHFGVNLIQVDDFQVALEKLTTPEQQPLLHFWRVHWDEFSTWSEAQLVSHFIEVSRGVFSPALESVIAQHLESSLPAVIEGDFVLPELAVRDRFDDQPNGGRVRAMFVLEEEAQIASNYQARDEAPQAFRARASALNGRWLHSECHRLGVSEVAARPWSTALARAIRALAPTES